MKTTLRRLRDALHRLVRRLWPQPPPASERQQALALIRAVDAGGVPLNPARVNQIARQLGLEVSRNAPMRDTLERIRAALCRPDLAPAPSDDPPRRRRS